LNRTLLAAFIALIPFASFAGERIISSDPQGITFEYTPSFGATDTTEEGGLRILLDSGDLVKLPGRPLLPVKYITIAIPPGSKPVVRLIKMESGMTTPGKLATYPAESTPSFQTLADFEGGQPIGKVEPRAFAGISTVRIPLYPVSSSAMGITFAKTMQIRVDFNAPANARTNSRSAILSPLQRAVILNADQAANWGRQRTSALQESGWPNGFTYRFDVTEEALYKLTYEALKAGGVEIPAGGVLSGQVKLFGNSGMELPNDPDSTATVGLNECAIYMNDSGDGRFGPGDWIIFYGRGAGGWRPAPDSVFENGRWRSSTDAYEYAMHHFDVKNVYWLNIDPAGEGKRMLGFASDEQHFRVVESAPTRVHLEPERFVYGGASFAGAGREWYGFSFDGPSRLAYTISAPSADTSVAAKLSLRIVSSGSGPNPQILIRVNNEALSSYLPDSYYNALIRQFPVSGRLLRNGYNTISFEQTIGGSAQALFDWLELYYFSKLDRPLIFESVVAGSPTEYRSSGLSDPLFFDVSEHNDVKMESGASIVLSSDIAHRRLILADKQSVRTLEPKFEPYFPPDDDIADLTSRQNRYDAILIVADGFWDVTKPLVDLYARRTPSLKAARVRLSELYNHFSGGVADVAAIRNFLRFTGDHGEYPPQYVIFCGDADYDYRNISRPEQPNMIPTWESGYDKGSISSDDWFVDFTSGGRDLIPEIATGRLTAQTTREMETIIEKLIAYEEEPLFGLWRNRITMVADDEFSETSSTEDEHVRFSEEIANNILPHTFDIVKVYETEFQRQWGREKPAAADALVASINAGTLIVNYFGHGNPTLWSHEHVFVQSRDMGRLEPSRRLPLYVAFTCDWAYFDDPASQSFPEQLLALPDAGSIGSIASTRLTYSSSNFNIARNFFGNMFGEHRMTPGEALALAKHQAWGSVSPTYHLLGDPAAQISAPKRSGQFVRLNPTPLVPLGAAEVSGTVLDSAGAVDPTFTGEAQFVLLDTNTPKEYTVAASTPYVINYVLPGATVSRGFLSIVGGRFGGDFVVPRDVTFNSLNGRAVAYFYNDREDGVAALDSIRYAGRAASVIDTTPPVITLYFDNRAYRPGDPISSEPLIIADLADSSGINLTGAMGHGVWLTVDGGRPIDLTESFRYSLDSHRKGSLEKRLDELEPGRHLIRVEAWDSFNNIGVFEQSVEVIDAAGALFIDRVLNWPNPFNSTTALTFRINRPADYEIRIFTVNGREIRRINGSTPRPGLVTDSIWNGYDDYGRRAGNGVYLYKVIATDSDGGKAEGLGRIAFIR